MARGTDLRVGRASLSTPEPLVLLNFGHPLAVSQHAQLEALVGRSIAERRVSAHIDREVPLAQAARALTRQVPLSSTEWQSQPLAVILPGLSVLAACLLAEIHGRSGHFPTIVNLRPAPDPALAVTVFEVAELVNLQAIRDDSRSIRER